MKDLARQVDKQLIAKIFFEEGATCGAEYPSRHIEDLCQCFWTDFVKYCDNNLFDFSLLVEVFPHYKLGIASVRNEF